LKCFEAESDGFLRRTVAGDETWVYYHQLETKKASKEYLLTETEKIPHTTICEKGYADSLLG
jgi:hypothetical protein